MKINSIEIKDFKGIENKSINFTENPLIITGKNGSGKTSVIEAVRFGITGESPVNAIKHSTDESVITVLANDFIKFERRISRPNKKTMTLMGRKTSSSSAKLALEDILNIKTKETDIILASDVLESIKPNELGAMFFNHDHRTISINDMIKVMENADATTKRAAIMIAGSDKLPPDVVKSAKELFDQPSVSLNMLAKAKDAAKSIKAEHAAKLKILEVKASEFNGMRRPEFEVETLKKDLEDIIGVQKSAAMNAILWKNYNTAKENKEKQNKLIIELKSQYGSIIAKEPNPKTLKEIKEHQDEINGEIRKNETLQATLTQNIKRLKSTLDALETTICPISKKLICNTDKTLAKNELQKELNDSEASLLILKSDLEKTKEKFEKYKEKESEYKKNEAAFERKQALKANIEKLIATEIEIPEEPAKLSITGLEDEKKRIENTLTAIKAFDEAEKAYLEMRREKRLKQIYDYLEEALGTKGPVAMAFLKATATLLERKVAERTKILNENIRVRFDIADGLKPYFQFDPKLSFQTYYSLSTGQKIIATLLLTDLLNYYCGSEILIIDELNDLDQNNFSSVIDFVTHPDVKKDYKNIILCMVNHDNLVNKLKDYHGKVDVMEI